MVIPVVEIGAGLARNGEGIFKSSGGDECDARAFAFEQCVGGDGCAVANFNGSRGNEAGNLSNCFKDGAAGSSGVDGNLSTSIRLPTR